MDLIKSLQGLSECVHARFESLEDHYPDQAAKVDPCPVKVAVGIGLLLFGSDIIPESIPCIGKGLAGFRVVFLPCGSAQVTAYLVVKSGIGILDAVAEGLQSSLGEILVTTSHHDIGPLFACKIGSGLRVGKLLKRLACILCKSIPAEDMPSGPPDKKVYQQVLKPFLSLFDQFEIGLEVGRVYGQLGDVVLMEQLDLVIDIGDAPVAWGGGEQTHFLEPA